MMSTAKAITNGYFPFGAVMINDKVAETFEKDETGRARSAPATPIPAIRSARRRPLPA
jgi:adenosylmethionine-8-amino-7-oxononanoate aminotransferase